MQYTLFQHQTDTVNFLAKTRAAMIGSDPGVGKTLCIIEDIQRRLNANPMSKTLVIAPKSILFSAWQDDIIKFAPHIRTSVATAPAAKRKAAFQKPANVYITNTDAVKWLDQQQTDDPLFFQDFETIVVDESGFFMNSSARTKALLKIRQHFKYARAMNGTLIGGPITNLYYQYFFLTGSYDVGPSFGKFRNMSMIAYSKPNMPQYSEWKNKPGIEQIMAKMLAHLTIRHALTDVVDMPARLEYTYKYTPNVKVRKAYEQMKSIARVELEDHKKNKTKISAVNASATVAKLLQISAGSILNENHDYILVDPQRFDLVTDLILQYQQNKPLVFFNYTSQRIYMMEAANKAGLKTSFIDGSVSATERNIRVQDFQKGIYDALFLQPMAASHGLTLTASTCSIWSVPIYRGDIYTQAQARNYRIGQKNRVTTIHIEAKNTLERDVYRKLKHKVSSIDLLNEALKE